MLIRIFPLQLFDVREQNYTHPAAYYQPIFDVPEDHGTVRTIRLFHLSDGDSVQSHTSIVDASGMVVSITSTVNLVFGSRIIDPVTGVLFNNEVRGIVLRNTI